MILRRCNGEWQIVASHLPCPHFGVSFDRQLVEQAANQRQTLFHAGHGEGLSVVLSPLLDQQRNVTGVVYGYRVMHHDNGRRGVRYLEAQLIELLAQSVSGGMMRLADEANTARQRVAYEQAFAPGVAALVELDAAALKGREGEVTVLFADLRGFAALCERLATADTYAVLGGVMDALTAAVMNHHGTLIDYYGDGLAAMWNAPVDQPHHVRLACRSAFDMLSAVPVVSQEWKHLLDTPLELGIGIHTGLAQVGNIGSAQRLKYGPRGSTVNLASRLERSTRSIGMPLVVTREVVDQLDGEFIGIRVCEAELAGIERPVDLFAVRRHHCDPVAERAAMCYEEALALYEAGELELASQRLQSIGVAEGFPTDFLEREIGRERLRRLGRRAGDLRATSAIRLTGNY